MPLADRTFTELMSCVPYKDIDDARDEIPAFMQLCRKWCQKEVSYVLGRKGVQYEKWKKKFLWIAFDAVAIMIWVRYYRKHVAIVFNYYFWCTHKNDDVSKCDVVLAYRGDTCFQPTLVMTTEEYTVHQTTIARVQAFMDELSLKENVQNMHKKQVKNYRQTVDRIESSDEDEQCSDEPTDDEELDLENAMDEEDTPPANTSKVSPGMDLRKRKSENNMQKENNKKQKKDNENSMQKEDNNEQKEAQENNMQKRTNGDEDASAGNDTKIKIKPTENENEENDEGTVDSHSEDKNPDSDSDTGSSDESEAAENNMRKGLRIRPKPKAVRVLFKTYHCLSLGCKVTKQTKKAVIKHMKETHKDYRYKCGRCLQEFTSWIGHYKHKKRHVGKSYICDDCGKDFQFGYELDEHVRGHTREELFECENCDKAYPSKRALKLHEKSHTDNQEYTCEFTEKNGKVCGQVCVSPNHLKQHHRGMHGEGWLCHCGKRFQWPGTMYNHKKDCIAKRSKCSS